MVAGCATFDAERRTHKIGTYVLDRTMCVQYVPTSRLVSCMVILRTQSGTMAAAAPEAAAAAEFPFGTVVVTSPSFVSGSITTTGSTIDSDTCSTSASASARRCRRVVGPLAHLARTLPPHVRVLGTSDPHGGEF